MSRREGHIEERSPGRWLIRYSITDPDTGRRRRVNVTYECTGKAAAEKELRRLLKTVDDGTHVDPTKQTTGEWALSVLDDYLTALATTSAAIQR